MKPGVNEIERSEGRRVRNQGGPNWRRGGWFDDRLVHLFRRLNRRRKVRTRSLIRSARARLSLRSWFIFTDYHTLDDCKLECNSSSASMDLSSVSGPPLSATDSSALTSVVLPVSADGSLNFFAGQSHGYSQLQFCSLFMSQPHASRYSIR